MALRVLLAFSLGSVSLEARAEDSPVAPWVLFADGDDDDDNGVADGAQRRVEGKAASDVRWLSARELSGVRTWVLHESPLLRWVGAGRALGNGSIPRSAARKLGLQGLRAGAAKLSLGERVQAVSVVEFRAWDAQGASVDHASSHASISRVLPLFLAPDEGGIPDRDALRWVAVGEDASLPERVQIVSLRPDGHELDSLTDVELRPTACHAGTPPELRCRATAFIRATADGIDRGHPESAARSLLAEVGGRLSLRVASREVAAIRVGGPRQTALGPIERFRSRLRVHVLRVWPGGPPAVGSNAQRALELVRAEVDTASLLWGQCGIHFGSGEEVPVQLVDPPPAHLIAVGCGLGLPASGGEVRLRIGRAPVRVVTVDGDSPLRVATRLAEAIRAAGFVVTLSSNPRIEPGAFATTDLSVRAGDKLVSVERDGGVPVSSDASLEVCVGTVDFSDGLAHFNDFDAVAGTLEERTLIKAYADGDSNTLDVFVVPTFSGAGRVGESFLDTPGASIQNTVLIDREAIRAGARSHVLAHELGHLLLDMPGHPDDYGVDQPSSLMDSDATDPSIFGPRRLSIAECERAVRQRGPKASAPLLSAWPLFTPGR